MKTLIGLLTLLAALPATRPAFAEETLQTDVFGPVAIYRSSAQPRHVVLFVSGDGGWNQGVVDMARHLTDMSALVVGIDIVHYLRQLQSSRQVCYDPAGDLAALGKFVENALGYPSYVHPILIGYSSGATLVYAALAQSARGGFDGAISMGFCPDLPLTRPLCKGVDLTWQPAPHGRGYVFLPAGDLPSGSWYAFQGLVDQVCRASATEAYVKEVPGGRIVLLPKVGHGFAVTRRWLPQFKDVFEQLAGERVKTWAEDPSPRQIRSVRDPLVPTGM